MVAVAIVPADRTARFQRGDNDPIVDQLQFDDMRRAGYKDVPLVALADRLDVKRGKMRHAGRLRFAAFNAARLLNACNHAVELVLSHPNSMTLYLPEYTPLAYTPQVNVDGIQLKKTASA